MIIMSLSLDDMIEKDQTNRLNSDQKVLIKNLFSQGVKHKMKVNIGRQLSSKPSGTNWENCSNMLRSQITIKECLRKEKF